MLKFNNPYEVFLMNAEGGDGGSSGGEGAQAGGGGKHNVTITEGGNEGGSAKVPFGTQGDSGDKSQVDHAALMGDYAKDEFFNDYKTQDGGFDYAKIAKSLKETKSLVGRKLGVPGEGSSDEERAEFYKALGVPDNAEGYEFKLPEDASEQLKNIYDQGEADEWAKFFKENNVPAETANAIRNKFFENQQNLFDQLAKDTQISDENFDKIASDIFGDKKKEEIQKAHAVLLKHAPAELRADIEKNVTDSVALTLAAALNGELKHLTGEDRAGGDGENFGGKSVIELENEARALVASPEYNSPFAKGADAHEAAKKKAKDLYQQISSLKAAQSKK